PESPPNNRVRNAWIPLRFRANSRQRVRCAQGCKHQAIAYRRESLTREKRKAPRQQPRRLETCPAQRSVGLLDRRKHPVATVRADEGPDLDCLLRLLAAADQP